MEFVAKLDDQISEPAAAAASAQDGLAKATKAADAQLRALDSTQQKAARRADLSAKAFNPKAYQQQVLAERQLAGAKEKALQQLGLGLSQKEKDEKASKKAAEEERKRSREAAAQKAAAGLGGAASQAKALALSLGAVAGVSGGLGLAKIAIGYQGMARLQMISYQASLQIRSLFRGVDSRPLERAYLQFTKLFSMSTVTGQAISKGLTRAFNGFFSAIEKAEPYFSAFVRGVVLGALKVEGAWLKARIWLFPLTDAIEDATGKVDGIKVAAYAGVAAVGLLAAQSTGILGLGAAAVKSAASLVMLTSRVVAAGASGAGAVAPFLALAAAIGAVYLAWDQISKLREEWDGDVLMRSLGIGGGESDADRINRQLDEAAARKKASARGAPARAQATPAQQAAGTAATPRPPVDQAMVDGRRTGAAMGAGIVAGLKSKEAEVTAGGAALAAAADRGVKTKAEIHSPARAFRRDAQQMGEGTKLGLKDSEKGVQETAAASLVPSPRKAGGGASGAPAAGVVLQLSVGEINVGAGVQVAEVRESFDEAMTALVQQVGVMLGVPRAGVANAG